MNPFERLASKINNHKKVKKFAERVGGRRIFDLLNKSYYSLFYGDLQSVSIDGREIYFDTSTPLSKELFARNLSEGLSNYENGWPEFFYSNIGEEDVVLDIGCQFGLFTVLAGLRAEKVYAFDIDRRNVVLAERNIRKNNLENSKILEIAIGGRQNEVSFQPSSYGTVSHVRSDGGEKVDMTTIDVYSRKEGIEPTVLKIDVEGAEYEVLKGAEDVLENIGPDIFLETHPEKIRGYSDIDSFRIIEYLNEKGYKTLDFLHGLREISRENFSGTYVYATKN